MNGVFANECVRVGVQHHRKESVWNCATINAHGEVRVLAVVRLKPGVQRGIGEQWLAYKTLQRRTPFNLFHHCGVVTDASVEGEVATICLAKTHAFNFVAVDARHQLRERNHRVVCNAERANKNVCRTARQHGKCGVAASEASGNFVQGAVATKTHHGVKPSGCRVLGKPSGVTAFIRLHHLHIVVLGKVLVDEHGVAGCDGRRERVDDKENSHGERILSVNQSVLGWVNPVLIGNNGGHEHRRLRQANP